MHPRIRLPPLLAATTVVVFGCGPTPAPDDRDGGATTGVDAVALDGVEPEAIEVAGDIRFSRSFEGDPPGAFHGVVRTRAALEALWAHLENVDAQGLPFGRGDVPPPPSIDFEGHTVLWFADQGARASFVSDIELVAASTSTLEVRVTVFHSDFGSRRLNLWSVPRYDGPVTFEVLHEYEERSSPQEGGRE